MDLPTCPACGQSVLDDEAADCPFCGASMSGKPQAKKPKASATPPKKAKPSASEKAPSKSSAAESSATTDENTGEQDPFAVDSTAETKKAIPLRPQPQKGRTHEVVCPMCETPGYTSAKAAGREVRCCNSECLVRVFTAPELPQEAPTEEPTKSGLSTALFAGGGLLVVALIAGGVWYFGFRQPEDPTIGGKYYIPGQNPTDESNADDASADASSPSTVMPKDDQPKSAQQIQTAALEKMSDACVQRDNNRSKPYCRRITAVALVRAGDVAAAQQAVEQMRSLRPTIPYYEIDPLVELAWNAHRSGDSAATKQAIDAAVAAASHLPSRGRSRLSDAANLAAVLVAANRPDEAQKLIEKHQQSNLEGQTAAELLVMRATKQFNADAFAGERPIAGWAAPQTAAAIIGLVAHGAGDAALQWAKSQQNVEVRSEATMIWADATLRQSLADNRNVDMAAIEAAANTLPPAGSARLSARLASRFLTADRQSDATPLITKAHSALSQVSPPAPIVLPEMKELATFQLPPATPLRMAALAAAELAAAEVRAGNREKSAAALELSMQFLRGIAPSPPAIRKRLNAITDQGIKATQAEIKRVMKLSTDEQARLAFNDYRKNCTEIATAADDRFATQRAVLTSLTHAGSAEAVSQEIIARNEKSDINQREPWATSRLAWQLADVFAANGNAAAASKVQALLQSGGTRRFPIDDIVKRAEKHLAAEKYEEAAEEFERRAATQTSEDLRDVWRLRLAGRLIAADKLDAAFKFLGAIGNADASFRETALWFAAAQASQAGQSPQVWELGRHASWTATELVSIYGGLIESLTIPKSPETAAAN